MQYEIIREKVMEPRCLELKVVRSFSNSKTESFSKPTEAIYPVSYSMIQNGIFFLISTKRRNEIKNQHHVSVSKLPYQ